MIEKDVVAVGAQALVRAEKRPDPIERGLEDRRDLARRRRSSNRGEQPRTELLDLHGVVLHSNQPSAVWRGGSFDEARALCHPHLVDAVVRWPVGILALTLALAAVGCAGEREDVLSAHDANEGEVRVFNVGMAQAWEAARAALRWNHADTIEEHRADGYMLATAGVSGWSWGAAMGVWLQAANAQGTQVRAIVSRRLATNVFAQSEGMLLDDIAKAVALEKQGQPLPDTDPD